MLTYIPVVKAYKNSLKSSVSDKGKAVFGIESQGSVANLGEDNTLTFP